MRRRSVPQQQTKPSTPRLSDVARQVKAPPGATSTGWPAVRDKLADLGVIFRWWQVAIAQIILSKTEDGKYATTIGGTGLSIPRQVGKTYMVGAIIFALCLLRPGLTVIWSAHRLRTAEETFKKLQGFARRRGIKPHILKITLGSGDEAIEFLNGSRILFGARAAGFGRGFDEVDVVVYDEAQILEQSALDDMIPATNQCRQETGALLLFMGTPPQRKDRAEVFTQMRTSAMAGDEDTAWIEFGADEGFVPTASPAKLVDRDWKQVEKANPSFPHDTPRESILRMRKQLGDESFRLEGLGIWDEGDQNLIIPSWPSRATDRPPGQPAALGLAMDLDRVWISLAVSSAGKVPHVAPVISKATERVMRVRVDLDKAEVLAEAARIARERRIPVVIDAKGPAAPLIDDLKELGVTVERRSLVRASFDDYVQACADFYDAAEAGEMSHGAYPALDDAVKAAGWRAGERRVWSRKSGDISMLEAATLAMWGASGGAPKRKKARSY